MNFARCEVILFATSSNGKFVAIGSSTCSAFDMNLALRLPLPCFCSAADSKGLGCPAELKRPDVGTFSWLQAYT